MKMSSLRTSACLTALCFGQTAIADVTASDVWDQWKDSLSVYGEDGVVIGAETASDGQIVVDNLSLTMDDGSESVSTTFDQITFSEQGDGTVRVAMPASYAVIIGSDDINQVSLDVRQTNLDIVVSGDPGALTHTVSADRYTFEVVEIVEGGTATDFGEIIVNVNNVAGEYTIKDGEKTDIGYDLTFGSIDILADIQVPESADTVLVSGQIQQLATAARIFGPKDTDFDDADQADFAEVLVNFGFGFDAATFIFDANIDGTPSKGSFNTTKGNVDFDLAEWRIDYSLNLESLGLAFDATEPGGTETILLETNIDAVSMVADMALPSAEQFENPDQMFADGFDVSAGYGIGSANVNFDLNVEGTQSTGAASFNDARFSLGMNGKELAYDVGISNLNVAAQTSEFPIPIDVSLGEYAIGFSMPLGVTENPADFGMSLNLADLTINDELWDLVDTEQLLPRDPATILVGLAGQGKLFFDLMDPAQQAALNQADIPGEIYSLRTTDLLVSAGGAEITGEGAFTFDNTDLETIPDVPRPEGDLTINISGANALIDNLVALGVLPEDQASMARLGMGMFARSVGDDQLETTVEVNPEGHVIVNGQRMR